jgi:hypothetical protein
MTLEEYNAKKDNLRTEYELNVAKLKKEYALSNNPYKIGDIIEDQSNKIKIEFWKFYMTDPPQLVYCGIRLNKDGTPNKKGDKEDVFQCNIKK